MYPLLTTDTLLEIGAAVASAVLSLDEHLSQTINFTESVFSKISAAMAQMFLQRCRPFHLPTLSDAGHVSCRKHFLFPKIMLPVGVLLSYSVLPYQNTLNASRTAANDFDTKSCSSMNTRSAR
jgi:hypothetical protein